MRSRSRPAPSLASLPPGWAALDLSFIGVAVFFLISGFVIPLSLERSSVRGFFIKRLARIYPTYWIALALGVGALFLSAAYWNRPGIHRPGDYIANAALVTEWSGQLDIISVAWTLQIELKFYLLAPLFAWCIARRSTAALLIWGVGVAVLYWLAVRGCTGPAIECWGSRGPIVYVAWEAMYLTFMLIGSVIYAHYSGRISALQALGIGAAMGACFVFSLLHSHQEALSVDIVRNYAIGLLIFVGAYTARRWLRLTRSLRFLADISYPLYVVHPLVGYVCMRLLMAQGAPYGLALLVALPLAIILATLIHRFIETPSMALGQRLTRSVASSRPAGSRSALGISRSA